MKQRMKDSSKEERRNSRKKESTKEEKKKDEDLYAKNTQRSSDVLPSAPKPGPMDRD